jgi:hypothetical protein
MSSHVRRAIQTALELEADEASAPRRTTSTDVISKFPSIAPAPPPKSPAQSHQAASPPPPPIPPSVTAHTTHSAETKSRHTSKLAQLAQAKAQQGQRSWASKAQATKFDAPGFTIHKSHTEYLTPIVNGPTATTAITTTYQTLGSLAQPKRSESSLAQGVEMFAPKASRGPGETKLSKLAMKSRSLHKPVDFESEPELALLPLDQPMFTSLPSRARASPSAFASLLVEENLQDDDRRAAGKQRKDSRLTEERRSITEKPRRRTHKRREVPPASTSSSQSFAFDVPSPDDIVFNARRGTSLAPRSMSTSTHLPQSTAPSTTSRSSSATPLPIRTSVQRA